MNQSQNQNRTGGFKSRAIRGSIAFTPCGAGDSLLKAFTIAAINAVSGNVIVLEPACPNFGSLKKARVGAEKFERGAGGAPRRSNARRFLNLSRNGRRDGSLRWNFSEEKIPAPNKQPKINTTSNRKDASSAYPK